MAFTHIDIFNGQTTQIGAGTTFPTTREEPMYIDGNDDGLEDGDMYFDTDNQVLGVRIGASWLMVPFQS